MLIEITPNQVHMHFELLLRAIFLPIVTVGEPVTQGAVVTGIQGTGVGVPAAAAVAAMNAGLVGA